jgi:hypothetical protein
MTVNSARLLHRILAHHGIRPLIAKYYSRYYAAGMFCSVFAFGVPPEIALLSFTKLDVVVVDDDDDFTRCCFRSQAPILQSSMNSQST